MLKWLLDPALFWMLLGTYEGEPIVFEPWQARWLHDHSRLRAVEKAPQIGFSWLCAAEALHECLMLTDATSGFVSVDQREATEKVLYARKLYSELPYVVQQAIPKIKDSTEEFYVGDEARPSRISSFPATAGLRGRKMSVYLDETDFYKDGASDSFRVALGRIARGGRVTLGSTCWGADTQLDKVMHGVCRECGQGEEGHPSSHKFRRGFSLARLPWTVVRQQDILDTIELAFHELSEDAFAEEYECVRGGGGLDLFPPDLIRDQLHGLPVETDPEEYTASGPAVAGYDVGKSRNPSVLTILERHADNKWRQTLLHEPRDDQGNVMRLPEQQEMLIKLMKRCPTLTLVFDAAGLGAQISQQLQDQFGSRAILMITGSKPDDLPPMDKGEMVTEIKRGLEADELEIATDRELEMQFRKTRKAPNGTIEQPGSRKKTHYDRFWSTTYAWYGVQAGRATKSIYDTRGLTVVGASAETTRRLLAVTGRRERG